MNQDLYKARIILSEGVNTCVLCQGSHTIRCTARGVRPLVDLLQEGIDEGFSAADKVVGKATAFLYVLLKVRAVYAPVMSRPAIQVLQDHGIEIFYDIAVDAIFNRDRTGFCPMETAVREINDPKLARDTVMETLKNGIHRK